MILSTLTTCSEQLVVHSHLEPIHPVLSEAHEPIVRPVPAGAVKVLPRWADEDEVSKWRLKYRASEPGEDCAGAAGSHDDGRPWVELELRSMTRELPLTGLGHGEPHLFKVALETPQGWSDWSRIVSCVPPSPELPGKCAAVFAIVKDEATAIIRWTKPIDYAAASCGGIRRYMLRVTWPPAPTGHDTGEREIVIEDDVDSFEVSDLTCLTEYRFQVAAENVTGWGEYSDATPVLNMPLPVPRKLEQPTLRRATHNTVVIQWQHPETSTVPVVSFRFRWTAGKDWKAGNVQELHDVPANASQHVVEGLTPGQTYIFQVTALNKYGMGIWSDSSIPIRTAEGRQPSKIQGLQVPHIYRSFITLKWTPAEENGYKVTRHLLRFANEPNMNGAQEVVPTVEQKNEEYTCNLRHLKKAPYYFQIAAFNEVGMSEWSDAVAVDMSAVQRLEDA